MDFCGFFYCHKQESENGGHATCTHVRTWKRMRVYHKRECKFNSTKSRACDWSTKREVKIRRLNTSINLHSDTALLTALFFNLLRNGNG